MRGWGQADPALFFSKMNLLYLQQLHKKRNTSDPRLDRRCFSFSWFEQPAAFSEPPRFPTIQTIKRIGLHVVGLGLAPVVEAALFLSLAMLLSLSACGQIQDMEADYNTVKEAIEPALDYLRSLPGPPRGCFRGSLISPASPAGPPPRRTPPPQRWGGAA